jgi:hypothetical protein
VGGGVTARTATSTPAAAAAAPIGAIVGGELAHDPVLFGALHLAVDEADAIAKTLAKA